MSQTRLGSHRYWRADTGVATGTRHGYHAITLGWYQSELIRRTDPAGRTLGQFLAQEIAEPAGLDLHIGVPDDVDHARIAHLHNWKRPETLRHLHEMPAGFVAVALNPFGLSARATSLPSDVNPWAGDYNRAAVRRRWRCRRATGMARRAPSPQLYGASATGDASLGLRPDVLAQLAAPPSRPPATPATRFSTCRPRSHSDSASPSRRSCSARPTAPSAQRVSAGHSDSPTRTPGSVLPT